MKSSKMNTSFLYFSLLIMLLSSAIALFARSSAFSISNLSVIGATSIPAVEIEKLGQGFIGQNLFLYDQDELREKLKLHPFVKEIQFKRKLPHTLIIEITERTPSALVMIPNGIVEVDNQGVFLRRFESWPQTDKPVITGVSIPETAGPGQPLKLPLLDTALKVLNETPQALKPLIGEIHVNEINQISLMLESGVEVRLGQAASWSDKLNALVQLMDDQAFNSIKQEVRYIDFTAAKPVIGRY